MFRTLPRILRNNHIIRICAICSLIISLSFSCVFAHPTFSTVSGMNQTVYNFTLWSDYSTTVNANYGNQTPTLNDLNLASMNLWLQKMEYYIAEQTQNMHVYVPSTNSVQTISNKHIPEMLSYLTYNSSYIAQNTGYLHSDLIGIDNSISTLNNQMNNALYDYQHFGQSAYSVGTTSRNTAVNTSNIYNELNKINWVKSSSAATGVYSDLNNTAITLDQPYTGKYAYVKFSRASDSNGLLKFKIRMRSYWQNYFYDFIDHVDIIRTDGSLMYSFDEEQIYQFYDTYNSIVMLNVAIPSNIDYYLKFTFNQKAPTVFFDPFVGELYYLSADTEDYYLASQLLYLKEANHTLKNLTVTSDYDDSNIIDAINNLALQDNDVKLNLTINNNTGSDGTSVINRLQNFFNNGTSISDFFDNVDDAESGWFTQTNSDLINTLSGGYVNLYE